MATGAPVEKCSLRAWEVALAAASGLALVGAFTWPALPELAFVAPAPFLWLISRPGRRPRAAAALGFAFGLVFIGLGCMWMANVTWAGWAALAAFLALGFAAFGAGLSALLRAAPMPVALAAPPLWIAMEWVRGWILTGLPWLYLGHAMSDRLAFIQIVELGGVAMVSFIVALVASAGVDFAALGPRRGRWSVAAALIVASLALAFGAFRLATLQFDDGPRLVLMSGGVPTATWSAPGGIERVTTELQEVYGGLMREHADEGELAVWSESVIFAYYNDELDPAARGWRRWLAPILEETGTPLLSGTNATDRVPVETDPRGRYDFNSAMLIRPDGSVAQRYDKRHLVPFGEYVPLVWLPGFARLTPYAADDPGYTHGSAAQPLMEWGGWRFGVLICFEDVFPRYSRRAARMGARFLVNLSNDSYFLGTLEIPQHWRIARFRAVETRLPVVRCSNIGATGFFDPLGRTVAMIEGSDRPMSATGAVAASVPVREENAPLTLFARAGDWFAWLNLAFAAALAAFAATAGRIPGRVS